MMMKVTVKWTILDNIAENRTSNGLVHRPELTLRSRHIPGVSRNPRGRRNVDLEAWANARKVQDEDVSHLRINGDSL